MKRFDPKRTAPSGQSLVEMTFVLLVISALMAAVMWAGISGLMSLQAGHGARLAAFDCDMRPGYCTRSVEVPEKQVVARLFSRGQREILARDEAEMIRFDSMGRNGWLFENAQAVQVRVDSPRVDGADKGVLAKLTDVFRSWAGKAGPALFDLSAPDQFTRATATAVAFGSRSANMKADHGELEIPRIEYRSRVALLSDSWAAMDSVDFVKRTRLGENPSQFGNAVSETFYMPAKDVLMPVFDLIGLDSGTRHFRDAFHQVRHDSVYPDTRVGR